MIQQVKSYARQGTFAPSDRPVIFGMTQTWLIRALAVVPAALLLLFVVAQPYVDPRWLFLDSLTAIELSGDCCHVYYGFVSNLGIYIWISTGVACLFSALLLRANPNAPRAWWIFALVAGCFTGWLALDDAFQVHEKVLPFFGVPQSLVVWGYAVFAALYAAFAIRVLVHGDFTLFLFACGCLAVSILIDQVAHVDSWIAVAFEDGAKFLGICCWSAFHLSLLYRLLGERPAARLVISPAEDHEAAKLQHIAAQIGQGRAA